MLKNILYAIILLSVLLGCVQDVPDNTTTAEDSHIIGGQKDKYGCLGPAGYSYDQNVTACIRTWELDDAQKEAARIAVDYLALNGKATITEVESFRCIGCFNIHLRLNDNLDYTVELIDWEVQN